MSRMYRHDPWLELRVWREEMRAMAQKSKWSRHSERASLHRLGERVRTARRERGLTQEDLAGALGISVAYMSLIERGGRNPPFTTVVAIATALGVHAGELCSE